MTAVTISIMFVAAFALSAIVVTLDRIDTQRARRRVAVRTNRPDRR